MIFDPQYDMPHYVKIAGGHNNNYSESSIYHGLYNKVHQV